MSKNILITGGAGFIGSHLSIRLILKGYSVTVLDNLSPQIHGDKPEVSSPLFRSIKDKVKFIHGSVNCREDLTTSIIDQDVIVHLAAKTGTGQSMYEIEDYSTVNIGGTAVILDLITNQKCKVKKIVVASSRAIYGEGKYLSEEFGPVYPEHRLDEDLRNGVFEVKYPGCKKPLRIAPTDEDAKLHPTSVYGITKQVQEQLVMTVTKAIGIAGVSFRYQNVYGPGQSLLNPYTGILSIFSTLIRNSKSINIFEDGMESRDFVYIDDVVNATISGIENDNANGQIFNVGSGRPITVNEVVRELISCFGEEVPYHVTGNYRVGDIRHNFADLSKIIRLLDYKPTVDFNIGLRKFVEWVKKQDKHPDNYQRSLEELKLRNLFK